MAAANNVEHIKIPHPFQESNHKSAITQLKA
jgi:hypothetical protein